MNQKIVFNEKKKLSSLAHRHKVRYEWHWRRIISISLLLAMSTAAIIYGLNKAAKNEAKKRDSTGPINALTTQAESVNTEPGIVASLDPAVISNTIEKSTRGAVVDIKTTQNTILPNINHDNDVLTSTVRFTPDAHIASVALGAKIDTNKVSRAVLTRKVIKLEPIDVLATDIRLNQFEKTLYFFSEFKNLQGQQIKHIWSYEGKVMAQVVLNIKSSHYRTFSTKNIMDTQLGHWRVDIVDEKNNLIAQKEFRVLIN